VWTGAFWKAATERAVRTIAHTLIALLATGDDVGLNIVTVNWAGALSAAAIAAVLSVMTSLAASGVGNPGPSLAGETIALETTR
jgi:Putative lactococcus lactis phage r1t holin